MAKKPLVEIVDVYEAKWIREGESHNYEHSAGHFLSREAARRALRKVQEEESDYRGKRVYDDGEAGIVESSGLRVGDETYKIIFMMPPILPRIPFGYQIYRRLFHKFTGEDLTKVSNLEKAAEEEKDNVHSLYLCKGLVGTIVSVYTGSTLKIKN